MPTITKSSTHSVKFANTGKQEKLRLFLDEYNRVVWWFVHYLWTTEIQWGSRVLDVRRNKLDVPDFISTTNIPLDTNLSARAMATAASEALGIVKSRTEKRRKQLFVLAKKMREGCVADVKKLQSKIDSNPLTEPTKKGGQTYARLNSACCEFIECQTGEFDGFLKLHCLGKSYGHIYLPIKWTRHSNKFVKNGFVRMTTWMVGTGKVMSVWQKDVVKSTGTKIIGADQGYTTCLSLSDNQVTGKCPHGHDLASIIDRMSRKKARWQGV
jgi:hypothetical protein